MERPVSVVMPVYNGAAFLVEAVGSMLEQSFRDLEVIVVDDGSTDETPALLASLQERDGRVKVIRQQNGGIVCALNRGVAAASGKYIARMDADDISRPDRIEIQLAEMERHTSVVALGGNCIEIDAAGKAIRTRRFPVTDRGIRRALENGGAAMPHPTMFVMRSALEAAGGYRERFRHAEDVDLWLRIGKFGEFRSIDKPVLYLRKHSTNISLFDHGRPQAQAAIGARICHFRRAWGTSDLGGASEAVWGAFQQWLSVRLQKVFLQDRWVNAVRSVVDQAPTWNDLVRLADPVAIGAVARYVKKKIGRDGVARKLALESLEAFP